MDTNGLANKGVFVLQYIVTFYSYDAPLMREIKHYCVDNDIPIRNRGKKVDLFPSHDMKFTDEQYEKFIKWLNEKLAVEGPSVNAK